MAFSETNLCFIFVIQLNPNDSGNFKHHPHYIEKYSSIKLLIENETSHNLKSPLNGLLLYLPRIANETCTSLTFSISCKLNLIHVITGEVNRSWMTNKYNGDDTLSCIEYLQPLLELHITEGNARGSIKSSPGKVPETELNNDVQMLPI